MMTKQEAEWAAEQFLNRIYGAGSIGSSMLIETEQTTEYEFAWSVLFDTVAHKETGDVMQAPMSRVVVVPKDGSPAHFPPTAIPLADYFASIATGEQSWLRG